MNSKIDPITDALDVGELAPPVDTGSLNLRPEIVDGLLEVRDLHGQLQHTIIQVMRRVVLPKAKEIGAALARVKAFYPSGKKGRGSRFYDDAGKLAGLKKAQICNYIQIHENWHRLIDYMADLPAGASPITSMSGAMEAIRAMGRPLQLASADPAEPEPEVVVQIHSDFTRAHNAAAAAGGTVKSKIRCTATEKPRQLLPFFTALQSMQRIPEELRDRLDDLISEIDDILGDIESEIGERVYEVVAETVAPAPKPERDWVHPMDLPAPAPVETPLAEDSEEVAEESGPGKTNLVELYPRTPEGLADLEQAIAAAGSGAALERELGLKPSAICQHMRRTRKALGL